MLIKHKLKIFLTVLVSAIQLAGCGELAKQEITVEESATVSTEEQAEIVQEEQENKAFPLQLQIAEQYSVEGMESPSDGHGYITLCEVSWQNLILADESAEVYPELAKKLQERNAELNQRYQEVTADLRMSAEEIQELQGEYFYPLSSNSSYAVQRADNYILSIREDFNDYWGGAHGMYGSSGLNYNVDTGEELVITDVLKSIERLPDILSRKIIEQYADEYEVFETLKETLEEYSAGEYNWTMGYDGITFYFQPYEIASYAMGLIEAEIWFDEMPELFYKEYIQETENGYSVALSLYQGIEVDLDIEDGKKNDLYLSNYYETEEDIEYGMMRLSIQLDEDTYTETECYGYEINPYLVCIGMLENKNYYLYVETVAENDYKTLSVYDLNAEEITLSGRLNGTGFAGVWDETEGEYGTYYKNVFLNPEEFVLETKVDFLGTFGGIRTYVIDVENGLPQAVNEDYVLPQNVFPIKSVISLEVMMLPEEKKEELPAGTDFYPIRTDGKTYMDMRLEDGRECRVYVESEDWNFTINGVDQWECFETLWYAG